MTILFIGGYPSLDRPHKNVFNYRAVQALIEHVSVVVVTHQTWKPGRPFHHKTEASERLTVHTISVPHLPVNNPLIYPLSMFMVNRFTRFYLRSIIRHVDLIHSVGASYSAIVGAYLHRIFRMPHIAQLIGSDVNSDIPQLQGVSVIRNLANGITHVGANSYELLKQFKKLYPESKVPQTVIYRGVNLEKYKPQVGMKRPNCTFLYLGGLPPYKELIYQDNTKGGVTLMEAWSQLEQKKCLHNKQPRLIFAGPGSDRERVHKWRKSLYYPEQVEIKGTLTPEQVREAYLNCSAVLVPSMEEGLPNVAVEACASGVPVIGSRVGGIPEVVEDGKTGRLVEPGNSNALAKALEQFVQRPDEGQQMGMLARRHMEAHFDHRLFVRGYLNVYNQYSSS